MFETIHNTAAKVQGLEPAASPSIAPVKPSADPAPVKDTQEHQALENNASQTADVEVSQDMLDDLEKDIEAMHRIGLRFTKHEETGKTMIRVTDRDNSQTIREIPPKLVLDLAAKMDEMLGLLFDKKV